MVQTNNNEFFFKFRLLGYITKAYNNPNIKLKIKISK